MIDLRGFVRKNKGFLSTLCFILAIVLMFWTVNSPAIVGASASTRLLPVYCVEREDKLVALSFDAAWGNEDTQQLIDILAQYKAGDTLKVKVYRAEGLLGMTANQDAPDGEYIDLELTIALVDADFTEEEPVDEGFLYNQK